LHPSPRYWWRRSGKSKPRAGVGEWQQYAWVLMSSVYSYSIPKYVTYILAVDGMKKGTLSGSLGEVRCQLFEATFLKLDHTIMGKVKTGLVDL
jgi:hypothetical protein